MDLLLRKEKECITCELAIQHFYKSIIIFFVFFSAYCSLSLLFGPQIHSCFSQNLLFKLCSELSLLIYA